MSRQ
jgi:hypothetical protein